MWWALDNRHSSHFVESASVGLRLFRESFLVSHQDTIFKERSEKWYDVNAGVLCGGNMAGNFQSKIRKQHCLKKTTKWCWTNQTWYLVPFSYKNQVQSLIIPGVNVHRANTEIPFTYSMRAITYCLRPWLQGWRLLRSTLAFYSYSI